ncbi:MAG: LysM peptidoglycan-binding domain-containing protein [Phycisphaerales bacterium]|nr:LysM peptidoglycan-binding domain-containing protein [Phycisphaerales bacterium]
MARKHMGAGKHWQALFNANKDKLKKPQDLRPGMELNVPAIESTTTPQPRTFTDLDTTTVTSRTDTRSTTYTVKKGDTLYGIAQRELGNSTRWQDILNANKQQLKGKATNLKPGMKLNMPSQQAPVSNKQLRFITHPLQRHGC